MSSLFRKCLVLACAIPGIAAGAASGGGGPSGGEGFYFEETFFPVYVNRNDTTSVTTAPGVATETGLGYDLRTTFGYAFFGQALVGLSYNHYRLNTKRSAVSGGNDSLDQTTAKSEYGPTLGYLNGGWRVLLTMFLSGSVQEDTKNADSTAAVTGDVTFKNAEMTGLQITVGYSFHLFSSVELGPSLVYRSVTYKKQSKVNRLTPAEDYANTALYSKKVDGSLSAMISLIARF